MSLRVTHPEPGLGQCPTAVTPTGATQDSMGLVGVLTRLSQRGHGLTPQVPPSPIQFNPEQGHPLKHRANSLVSRRWALVPIPPREEGHRKGPGWSPRGQTGHGCLGARHTVWMWDSAQWRQCQPVRQGRWRGKGECRDAAIGTPAPPLPTHCGGALSCHVQLVGTPQTRPGPACLGQELRPHTAVLPGLWAWPAHPPPRSVS